MPDSFDHSQASVSEFDERILALTQELLWLRRERNALVGPCRLPPEILAEVLQEVQLDGRIYDKTGTWIQDHDERGWVSAMLVCHKFRETAIQTPALWTVLDSETHPKEWLDLCWKRSGNATVYIHAPHEIMTRYAARAHTVYLEPGAPGEFVSLVSAPALQALRYDDNFISRPIPSSYSFHITGTSLVNLTLQQLYLVNTPHMPSLRRLVLDSVITHTDIMPFVRILSNSPMLEELLVYGALSSDSYRRGLATDDFSPATETVTLPRLKTLYLNIADPKRIPGFMRVLPLPSHSLAIKVLHMEEDERILVEILAAWVAFSRQCSTKPTDPVPQKGHLICHASMNTAEFFIGKSTVRLADFDASSPSFCFLSFRQSLPRSLLKFIGSIHINADHCRTYRLERLFSSLEPTHNLQVVTLEKCGILDPNEHKLNPDFIMDVRTIIKQWIKRRRSIDQFYFIACNERMRQLAYELEREKIVRNVIWDGTAQND
jgi:hypothetical protein